MPAGLIQRQKFAAEKQNGHPPGRVLARKDWRERRLGPTRPIGDARQPVLLIQRKICCEK